MTPENAVLAWVFFCGYVVGGVTSAGVIFWFMLRAERLRKYERVNWED